MKNLQKSRLILFILGLVFIILIFAVSLIPKGITKTPRETLPEGVHIPININTADTDTLRLLDGVGIVTAEKIIAYRTESGGFEHKEDLLNVEGIGEETFEKIKNYIDVEG